MACLRSSNTSGQSPASNQGPASQIRPFSFPAQASQTQQAMFCLGLGKGPVERLVSLPYFSNNEVSERGRDLPEVRQPESNTTHPLDSGVLTPPPKASHCTSLLRRRERSSHLLNIRSLTHILSNPQNLGDSCSCPLLRNQRTEVQKGKATCSKPQA